MKIQHQDIAAERGTAKPSGRGRVVIVEPDSLMRWSIETYLRRWFDVRGFEDAAAADRVLASQAVDALVFSDEYPRSELEPMRAHARSANPQVRVICTVSDDGGPIGTSDEVIEKPFALRDLAQLLGVEDAAAE